MTDYAKTVLLITNTERPKNDIIEAFKQHDFHVDTLSYGESLFENLPPTAPKAILLQLDHVFPELDTIIVRIKNHFGMPNIPVLALLGNLPPLQVRNIDSTLLAPYHPLQIVMRTQALTRLAEMETEITLRLKTLEDDFDIIPKLSNLASNERFRILFIGKASAEFMIVINALQKKHVNITAAFTSFTAFDYLYEREFDAVVMNGLTGLEPAFSVTETMRRNAKLYHVPALLLVEANSFKSQDDAYNAGINDIIDISSDLSEISARILEQANFHRTHVNLKKEFSTLGGSACIDKTTNLYNYEFFDKHLANIRVFYKNANLPISICVVKITIEGDQDRETCTYAYQYYGDMIKNLVRMQDVSARLDKNVFAIAFPGQSISNLDPVSKRITALLEGASINHLKTGEPLKLRVDINFSDIAKMEQEQKEKRAKNKLDISSDDNSSKKLPEKRLA